MTELIIIFSIMGLMLLGLHWWLRQCSNYVKFLNERQNKK